jgi:hypothetical protein
MINCCSQLSTRGIREVFDSNLGLDIGSPEVFRGFPHLHKKNAGTAPRFKPRPLPSKSPVTSHQSPSHSMLYSIATDRYKWSSAVLPARPVPNPEPPWCDAGVPTFQRRLSIREVRGKYFFFLFLFLYDDSKVLIPFPRSKSQSLGVEFLPCEFLSGFHSA